MPPKLIKTEPERLKRQEVQLQRVQDEISVLRDTLENAVGQPAKVDALEALLLFVMDNQFLVNGS